MTSVGLRGSHDDRGGRQGKATDLDRIDIRDPNFATKTTRVLDLYARIFDGVPLDKDEYVISSDEKTSIQARCHPTLAPGTARTMRLNHEYDRGGALAYLAVRPFRWTFTPATC
ncbi:hypothetical protein SAMN05216276_108013 [Streptosporangium subroseum]|uniref:Uncharacterized protein n=1 Tax=Streptosporangium subroseum TaxID=106412 RepID=A0A239P2B3_9ACTN|nr:hypothetical protein [Streptosporangium subroseum]SNT60873.1 hypothetical protein SAMN05216276_108013 [Streptosporangium subroseum]